jgi:hypothetical protein
MYYVMQDTNYCIYICITKINVLKDIIKTTVYEKSNRHHNR